MPIEPSDKKAHVNFWYFVAAVALILLLQQCWQSSQQVETVPYSDFRHLLEEGRISEIAVSETSIRGTLTSPLPGGQRYIYTVRVDPDFAAELAQYDVTLTGEIESNLVASLLSWILPALIFVGIWMFFIRRFAHNQSLGSFMIADELPAPNPPEQATPATTAAAPA